jgi:putative ABC transport system permease protein
VKHGIHWRLIEWYLRRHLTPAQLHSAVGDLAEEMAVREQRLGRFRARVWLLVESLSVARAYRSHGVLERRRSRRTIMGGSWLDDARLARRRLAKRPAATAASVFALAVGIGSAAATWSLLSSALLRPLSVGTPDRLFVVEALRERTRGGVDTDQAYVYPTYRAIRDAGVFEGLAAGGSWSLLVTERDAVPQPRTVYFASHDFFATLGVPVRGRGFEPNDDRRGASLVAVISDRYWRRVLGADPSAIGQTVRVSNTPATIVGIAPRGFRGLSLVEAPDLYLPLHTVADVGGADVNYFAEPIPPARSSPTSWIQIVGRLTSAAAAADAAVRLRVASPNARIFYRLVNVNTAAIPEIVRAGVAQFTQLLTITVGLLMLVGCLSVGMLLLVRTEARRDEFAMCLALGGTRLGLARGIVIEGALLSLAGAVLAVPVASWALRAMSGFMLPGQIDVELLDLAIDARALAAIAAGGTVSILLVSFVAAAFGYSPNIADVLRSRAGATPRVTRRRTRAALVTAQVAVALVLLAGAGLFARSLAAALAINPGFDASRVVTGSVQLRQYGYTPQRAGAFFDQLRERLDAAPNIQSAAIIRWYGSTGTMGRVTVDGVSRQFPSELNAIAVDDRYFRTLGMRIVKGRDFSSHDTMTAPLVVIVSESLGRAIAAGGDPVGHRITDAFAKIGQASADVAEIVGVVPDVITNVADSSPLVKYYSLYQRDVLPHGTLVLRTEDSGAAIREAMSAIRSLDSLVTPPTMLTIEDQLRRQMSAQSLGGFVLGALGGIAILLTLLGAYVLAESTSTVRRREFSIRRALGATRTRLGSLALAETVRLVGIGLVAGLALAWAGAGAIRTFLFRVEPLDPLVLLSVSTGILVVTLLVSLKPALDAARVDVAHLLRDQ